MEVLSAPAGEIRVSAAGSDPAARPSCGSSMTTGNPAMTSTMSAVKPQGGMPRGSKVTSPTCSNIQDTTA